MARKGAKETTNSTCALSQEKNAFEFAAHLHIPHSAAAVRPLALSLHSLCSTRARMRVRMDNLRMHIRCASAQAR